MKEIDAYYVPTTEQKKYIPPTMFFLLNASPKGKAPIMLGICPSYGSNWLVTPSANSQRRGESTRGVMW